MFLGKGSQKNIWVDHMFSCWQLYIVKKHAKSPTNSVELPRTKTNEWGNYNVAIVVGVNHTSIRAGFKRTTPESSWITADKHFSQLSHNGLKKYDKNVLIKVHTNLQNKTEQSEK